jgi:hypothetical protein
MAIKLVCPNPRCGKALKVRDELAGMIGACPACGAAVRIPRTDEPVEIEVVPTIVREEPVEPARATRPELAPAASAGVVGPLLVGGVIGLGLYALSVVLPWYTVSLKGNGLLGAGTRSSGSVLGITLGTAVAGLVVCLGAQGFMGWAWLKGRELLVLATRVAAGASLVAFFLALGQMFRAGSAEGGVADVFKVAIEVRSAVGIYLAMVASIAAGAAFGLLGLAFPEALSCRLGTEATANGKGAAPVRKASKIPVAAWIGAGAGLLVLVAGGGVGYWLMIPRVHLENLTKVRSGMTLEEVEALLGPGEVVSTTKLPSGPNGETSVYKTVRWHAEKDGAKEDTSLTFLDGKAMMGFGPNDDAPATGKVSEAKSKMEELAKKLGDSPEFKEMVSSAKTATSAERGAGPARRGGR